MADKGTSTVYTTTHILGFMPAAKSLQNPQQRSIITILALSLKREAYYVKFFCSLRLVVFTGRVIIDCFLSSDTRGILACFLWFCFDNFCFMWMRGSRVIPPYLVFPPLFWIINAPVPLLNCCSTLPAREIVRTWLSTASIARALSHVGGVKVVV